MKLYGNGDPAGIVSFTPSYLRKERMRKQSGRRFINRKNTLEYVSPASASPSFKRIPTSRIKDQSG